MKFTLHGLIENHSVRVTWADGRVDGDEIAMEELVALADVLEGKPVGPEPDGPFTMQDHLADPLSAQVLIEDVLDEVTEFLGELPFEIGLPPAA
ncbi:MAG: hypothetical protein N2C14_17425 [Planctomycetales bacterium]